MHRGRSRSCCRWDSERKQRRRLDRRVAIGPTGGTCVTVSETPSVSGDRSYVRPHSLASRLHPERERRVGARCVRSLNLANIRDRGWHDEPKVRGGPNTPYPWVCRIQCISADTHDPEFKGRPPAQLSSKRQRSLVAQRHEQCLHLCHEHRDETGDERRQSGGETLSAVHETPEIHLAGNTSGPARAPDARGAFSRGRTPSCHPYERPSHLRASMGSHDFSRTVDFFA